jgi:vitamin B12 transporter
MRSLAWIVLLPCVAYAQELGVGAEIERPIARAGGEDPTASATDVDAQDRPAAIDTLENAVREAPGVRPLSSGGYGASTTLSLRGADPDQLEVMFGDTPLTTADGSAFDLSSMPLFVLERVEVYRSGAPTWLGAGGMGGVLRLIPRARGAPFEATLGIGSYGLGHVRAGTALANDDVSWVAAGGITTSEGDYPYLDDGRTALDPSDDVERRRTNGWLREAVGLGHLRVRIGDGTLSASMLGQDRYGGVAGPASQPAHHALRNEASLLAALAYELTERGRPHDRADWRVAITTSFGYRRRQLTDLYGEIGLGLRASDDHAWRSILRAAASGHATEWLELTGVALYTHEELDPNDSLARQPNAASQRDAGTFALEGRFHGRVDTVALELRPSARLSIVGSRLSELRPEDLGAYSESLALAPTLRLAGAIAPIPELAIAASFATATRTPSMVELFGDRGYLRGDTSLRPERAETIDLGATLRGRHDVLSGTIEARGFLTFASDLIRYRRTSQYTAVPENVDSALLFGGELGVRGAITRHFELVGALTLLETQTPYLGSDRRLPLRPWMTVYLRPTATAFTFGPIDRLELWADLTYVAESSATPANDVTIPARTRVGAGISGYFWGERLRLDLFGSDLADERGTDLLGFPLPGRTFGGSLTIRAL